jgi:hypothetical protein
MSEISENFGGHVPLENKEALEREINENNDNILESKPLRDYFEGEQ